MKANNCIVTIISSNRNQGFELPVVARTPGYTWYQTEVQTSNPYQVVRAIEGTQVFSGDSYPDEEMIVTVTHPNIGMSTEVHTTVLAKGWKQY